MSKCSDYSAALNLPLSSLLRINLSLLELFLLFYKNVSQYRLVFSVSLRTKRLNSIYVILNDELLYIWHRR